MTKFPSRSPLTSRVTRFVGATACALVLSALSVVIVSGQQAGVNVNVLPIVSPDGNPPTQTDVAAAALRGDLYLDRQVSRRSPFPRAIPSTWPRFLWITERWTFQTTSVSASRWQRPI